MKKCRLVRFINKKHKGNGDLIASLFVILALTIFSLFFINSIADINTRIQMDQVARKYILRMESEGYLTASDKSSMISDLMQIPSVKAVTDGSDISFSGTTESEVGYGGTIILKFSCPAAVTKYVSPSTHTEGSGDDAVEVADTTTFGGIRRDASTKETYVVTKSSTAKY